MRVGRWSSLAGLVVWLGLLGACGPNYERVADDLRRKNLHQTQELTRLESQNARLEGTLKQLQAQSPTVASLPPERLKGVFLVDRIEIRPTTSIQDLLHDGVANGFRVHVRPLTAEGFVLPAAGKIQVEAFDLALQEGSQRLGRWNFTAEEAKKCWYTGWGLDQLALDCPWVNPPQHSDLTFKVTFEDPITGRVLSDQTLLHLALPAKR